MNNRQAVLASTRYAKSVVHVSRARVDAVYATGVFYVGTR